MGILDIFRKKAVVDLEAQRREYLGRFGRITDGTIIDSEKSEVGERVFYSYSVHGADYESSEILTEAQSLEPVKFAPGAKIGVRYDPKQHANSMLA